LATQESGNENNPLVDQQLIKMLLNVADQIMAESPFFAYQTPFAQRIIEAVVEEQAEEITALFSRQSGKTEAVARVVCVLLVLLPFLSSYFAGRKTYQKGIFIGLFAPVKMQADNAYERIRRLLNSPQVTACLKQLSIEILVENGSRLLLSNGSSLHVVSCTPMTNIEGLTLHLAFIEEAQDIPAGRIEKSIEPMLSATSGTLIMIGTANTVKSCFWEMIQRNLWRDKLHPQRQRHFENDWKTVIQYNPAYRRFLNIKFQERGAGWLETDIYRMSYGCEFILERGQFFSHEQLKRLEYLGQFIGRGPYLAPGDCTVTAPTVAGIDWGKAGDSTVVTVIAKYPDFYRIVDWLELHGDDYDSQFESLIAFLRRFPNLQKIAAETNGVGDPMTDRLKKAARQGQLKCGIYGFLANEAHNSDGYKNLMMDFAHGEKLLLPADEASRQSAEYQVFSKQLTEVAKEWHGSLLKVRAVKSTAHDDYVSSLMIAYWAARQFASDDLFREFYQSDFKEGPK
jgi:hypothetical protein